MDSVITIWKIVTDILSGKMAGKSFIMTTGTHRRNIGLDRELSVISAIILNHREAVLKVSQIKLFPAIPPLLNILSGIAVLAALILTLNARIAEGADGVDRIQKAYEGIRDLRGSFTQKSTIKDLKKTETYRGEFFLKPPMRMKWSYRGKDAQDLTINKDTVLIYKKSDNQAFRGRFDKATYGQSPVALLGGFGSVRDEFNVTPKGDVLILKPKKPMGAVTSVIVTLADEGFPIRSFVINDTYGNIVEIELRDIQTNSGIKDNTFELTLPKGVNVMEQ